MFPPTGRFPTFGVGKGQEFGEMKSSYIKKSTSAKSLGLGSHGGELLVLLLHVFDNGFWGFAVTSKIYGRG